MRDLLELNAAIYSLFGVGVFGMLTVIFRQVRCKRSEQEQRFVSLEFASKSILHDKLFTRCEEYIKRQYITVDELDNLDYLYRAYKGLGGNGTGDILMKKVEKLEIKGERMNAEN